MFGMTPQKLSAGNVLLNAIVLPLSTAIDKRLKKCCVSVGSLVTAVIRFPRSWTIFTLCTFHDPPVFTDIGTNIMCGHQCACFVTLLPAVVSAAAHAWIAVLCRCDFANVSGIDPC